MDDAEDAIAARAVAGPAQGAGTRRRAAEPGAGGAAEAAARLAMGLLRLRGAYAPETLRVTAQDHARFAAWCEARCVNSLPADPDTVAAYVDDIYPRYRMRTVQAKLDRIRYAHLAVGAPDPTKAQVVKLAFRRGVRAFGRPPRQASPLSGSMLDRLRAAAAGEGLMARRDRLILRLGYETLCRRSELVALRLEDVERLPDGTGRIRVRRSKTDPAGVGTYAFVSAEGLAEIAGWAAAARIAAGPILRPIYHARAAACRVLDRQLTSDVVRNRLEAMARAAGIDLEGFRLTSHSMRVGAAQDLAGAGCSLFQVMRAGRWRNLDSVVLYVREAPMNPWSPQRPGRSRG